MNAGADVSPQDPRRLWREEYIGPVPEGKMRSRHQNLGSLQLLLPQGLGTEHVQSKAQYQVAPAPLILLGKEGTGERRMPCRIQHGALHLVGAQEMFVALS